MSKRKAEKIAGEIGATLEINTEDRKHLDVEAIAPLGKVWIASGLHGIVQTTWDSDRPSDAWKALAEDMAQGVETCEDPTCEVCFE